MASLFRSVASRHPRRPALVADGARLTFGELDTRSDQLAEALRGRGIARGALIGTLLLDGIAMVELLIAAAKLGATIVAMNWRLAPMELAYIIADANPDVLFVSECFAGTAKEATAERRLIIVPDGDAAGAGGALGVAASDARLSPETAVSPADPWYMLYTSGTTGRPKGCQHSQSGYFANVLGLLAWSDYRECDRGLLSSPLFHVGGLSSFLAWHTAGACVVVAPRRLDAESLLRLVSTEEITIQSVPPLMTTEYLEQQVRLELPIKLRLVIGGGGMNAPALLERVRDTLKVDMILGYGQSEVGGFTSFIRLADQLQRPTSCGKPLPHLQVRIVDDAGTELPEGESGELQVRGPSVTIGYHNLPEATAETLADGWLRSGDIVWRDADGFLHFAGRKKELVKTGGENVYPGEVEKILNLHPAIADSCVVGVPNPRYGEAVKAFVVLKPGERLRPLDVANWCDASIAGYKRPRFVEFVESIPRDFQGKPQRKALSARPATPEQATDAAR